MSEREEGLVRLWEEIPPDADEQAPELFFLSTVRSSRADFRSSRYRWKSIYWEERQKAMG